ncbi:MAG: BspA family leucine-rich repeat surface protein [Clostridiales bacterium]|nr:BspA family leucine-rich repeat surface protein [Clostridiales bacterium]
MKKKLLIGSLLIFILILIGIGMHWIFYSPTIAPKNSWYKAETDFSNIAQIDIVRNYKITGNETESWNADIDDKGRIKCYIIDKKLIISLKSFGEILANENSSKMFSEGKSLESINGINLLNTKNVTNMSEMFYNCGNLRNLDLSNFNTDKVIDMGIMFGGCIEIGELSLQGFNTENVENMAAMFFRCGKLKSLDVSNFNTEKVKNMRNMFSVCEGLEELDISSFDTKNVENMRDMFRNSNKLRSVKIGEKFVYTEDSCLAEGIIIK